MFSEKFKIRWWAFLNIFLFIVILIRYRNIWKPHPFDYILYFVWFWLLIYPLGSEFSVFGFKIKKELEKFKEEIIGQIKIHTSTHQQTDVSFHLDRRDALPSEIKKKEEEEVEIEEDAALDTKSVAPDDRSGLLNITSHENELRLGTNNKVNSRLEQKYNAEKAVIDYLIKTLGENFKPSIKLSTQDNKYSIVADGLFITDNKVEELYEIRYMISRKCESIYFIISRYLEKLRKIKWNLPVCFVFVSNSMDSELVNNLRLEVAKLNESLGPNNGGLVIHAKYLKYNNNVIEVVR